MTLQYVNSSKSHQHVSIKFVSFGRPICFNSFNSMNSFYWDQPRLSRFVHCSESEALIRLVIPTSAVPDKFSTYSQPDPTRPIKIPGLHQLQSQQVSSAKGIVFPQGQELSRVPQIDSKEIINFDKIFQLHSTSTSSIQTRTFQQAP